MFQLEQANRIPIRMVVHGRYGRGQLLHPYDNSRRVEMSGLGGFFDTLKRFGSGIVQSYSLGMYDPRKNRFYVPFTGGQVRNAMQGVANVATLGLVNTDKFFGSNTMRTIGNIGAGIEAAGAAALAGWGGYKLMGGGTGTTGSTMYTSAIGPTPSGAPLVSSLTGTFPSYISSAGSVLKSVGTAAYETLKAAPQILKPASEIMGALVGGGGGAQLGPVQEVAPYIQIPIIQGGGAPGPYATTYGQPLYQGDQSLLPVGQYYATPGGGFSGGGGGGGGGYVSAEAAMAEGEAAQGTPGLLGALMSIPKPVLAVAGVSLIVYLFSDAGSTIVKRR